LSSLIIIHIEYNDVCWVDRQKRLIISSHETKKQFASKKDE